MAFYRSPDAEPYQESQGAAAPQDAPSPVELHAFYEIQRRESQEKRLTKRRSDGPTTLWARKPLKRSPTAPSSPSNITGSSSPSQPTPSPQHTQSLSQDTARHAQHSEMEKLEDQKEKLNNFSQMNQSTSLIPDNDLPAWYHKDIWASVPPPMYKASFRLHNPVGPRWYKNYHLIPPSQLRPAARPPSVFSPSFPPMGTTSMPERSLDSRMGPSRTPSGSPLPTPSSSQTKVADAAQKPRSRKPSLTTPDGIELDITDPWGATWHHPSPYDFGISPTSTIGTSASENLTSSRPRRASLAGFQIKRKAAPSPLSQSTSAVHLQPPSGPNVLRKLSKRKTAAMGTIFRRGSEDKRSTVSMPATPIDGANATQPDTADAYLEPAISSSSASIMTKTSKKEKRGSVLGRLAKKFSILKKNSGDTESVVAKDDWHHVSLDGAKYNQIVQPPLTVAEPSSIGDVNNDPSPPLNDPMPHVSQDADRSSSLSIEVPFATGRLTVVNPDLPSSDSTPMGPELSLPPEKPDPPAEPEPSPVLNSAENLRATSIGLSPGPQSNVLPPDPTTLNAQLSQHTQHFTVAVPVFSLGQTFHDVDVDVDVEESLPPTPPAKSRAPSPALPPPILSPDLILQDVARNVKSPVSSAHDSSTVTVRQATRHSLVTSADIVPPSGTLSQALSQPDVPFSFNDDSVLVPPRAKFSYAESFTDSPLSTSSLDVGPPTPYYPVVPIPTSPKPQAPHPLLNQISFPPIHPGQLSQKQTETFKLVRGDPGRVLGSTDTIVAAGQQWEVVETVGKSVSKARIVEQKGAQRKSPEANHEKDEMVDQEHERQRMRGIEKLATNGVKMKENHKEKERRNDVPCEDKERRREGSHDEREDKRRLAEKERERLKEREREVERDRLREQKEREKERDRQRQKDLEREKEREREVERDRLREQKEREKERDRQRQKDLEREKERQREREREKEKEMQRERERERQKEKERERERQKEKEKERERARQKEKERERERQKERERERERQKEREREKEKERQRERERERARHKENEQEEREREQRHKERRERDKDRRDQERRSRHSEETQRHRTSSQSHVHHRHETRDGPTSTLPSEIGTTEARHGHHRGDEREGHKIKWPERIDRESTSSNALPPIPTQPTTRPPLQRNPSSTSTRPTSELPSAAELMALRAKEAFEMERLFKARSMYGQEPEGITPNSIPSNLSDKGSTIGAGAVHGSSHTAYVFNQSFQNSRRLSNAPPPHSREALHPDRPFSYLSDLGSIPSLDSPTNRSLSNPLPEPPKSSAYQPTPLAILEASGAQTSDYWTKYTITTAH